MRLRDLLRYTLRSVTAARMRSLLTALGITVGIASVVLLTSIGEGIHRYVLSEFTQFGTNLISVTPGRSTTFGISGAIINTVRPLTLDDAESLGRIPGVEAVVPMVQGNAAIERGQRTRRTAVYGVGPEMPRVWQMQVALGRFLPAEDPRLARPFAVLGSRMRKELFGSDNPLGRPVRIGGERFRVIGVLAPKGQMLGFDLDDAAYIPTRKAMALFDRDSLMEVDLLYTPGADSGAIAERIRRTLSRRHGNEDFTIITQDQMLDTLGSILDILTLAVAALGGISLLVGGVGILTIMTIAVTERTGEVGLLRAIGARRRQILLLFLGEAVALSGLGGLAGLLLGAGGAWLLGTLVPALPTHTPWSFVLLAETTAIAIGLLSGVTPALRAARLDPVAALREE
ncbi:MAG TPA: FtsX-like permease family protein [Sedimenticola thiotaurini]|uniref:FtsX-like permease family protein n=1 Tax=Sedimenticola thiotaurini TaxID=1543721 RepID=A0A831RN36_9GAMM|nr:FtsX-like permease family protein [Sedimenticola thiotaurini]